MSDDQIQVCNASMCNSDDIVDALIASELPIIQEAYGENARKILEMQYKLNNPGTYVLRKGEKIIGLMKLHLPGSRVGQTVSISSLMRRLGPIGGLKATLLMSNWDEYKLSYGEAYIEYLAIIKEYHNQGYEVKLLDKAKELAIDWGASYITIFNPIGDERKDILEKYGFFRNRSISSPIAKLYGVTSKWDKYRYRIDKITPNIKQAYLTVRRRFEYREARSALQLSLWLLIVPIVGGSFAFVRNFPLAVLWWVILFLAHIAGVFVIYYEKSMFGKWLISAVMVLEAGNFVMRMINTDVWFDRGWLLLVAFIDLWIAFIILRISNNPDAKSKV
ncbi:MAG: GNAT family N-acetyltransferase [Candidatus Heimdallarchaeota archaeon]|nr:GNAT family N-acetyltransferase [Candidatus Heimdallarchaeota archaeon]